MSIKMKIEIRGLDQYLDRFFRQDSMPHMVMQHGSAQTPPKRRPVRKLKMKMTRGAFWDMHDKLTSRPPEAAGVLVGPFDSDLITHFILDVHGQGTPAAFSLHGPKLNEQMRPYLASRLEGKGYGHSQPLGCNRLSRGDLQYLQTIWANPNNDAERIWMPIVVGKKVIAFAVDRHDPWNPKPATVVLI